MLEVSPHYLYLLILVDDMLRNDRKTAVSEVKW